MFQSRHIILVFLVSLFVLTKAEGSTTPSDSNAVYLQHTVKKGESLYAILKIYGLLSSPCNISKFQELNKLSDTDKIFHGKKYSLPIVKISQEDLAQAPFLTHVQEIRNYTQGLHQIGLIKKDHLVAAYSIYSCSGARGVKPKKETVKASALGKKHEDVEIIDKSLKGEVYYLVSGHGGPDPGAMYTKNKICLCEDEYAYDVTLRLYRNLLARGATVHMIIEDPNDGLRSARHLKCDRDERCEDRTIPLNQLARLSQRTEYINRLYQKHKKEGVKKQEVVIIHVDSRPASNRQDVFFLHAKGSKKGRAIAQHLHNTFKKKYSIHRKTGKYDGTVVQRNLYVLKRTHPPAVYVELANIQNPRDQKRIVKEDNRQALADWLYEGLTTD